VSSSTNLMHNHCPSPGHSASRKGLLLHRHSDGDSETYGTIRRPAPFDASAATAGRRTSRQPTYQRLRIQPFSCTAGRLRYRCCSRLIDYFKDGRDDRRRPLHLDKMAGAMNLERLKTSPF